MSCKNNGLLFTTPDICRGHIKLSREKKRSTQKKTALMKKTSRLVRRHLRPLESI